MLSSLALPARAASGLVAGYGFAEGSGSTTADASGNGLTGSLVSGPAWVLGRNGTGLSFDGSTTYVDLGNPAALRLTGSMTLSAWVYETANVGDDGQIVAKSEGAFGWQLKSSPDTGVRTFAIGITSSTGQIVQRYSKTVRALNTWYHLTGAYDAAARTLNVYVNGVLDNGVLSGTVGSSQLDSPVNANIGRRTGGFNIRGTIDDVRIYGRALTAAEIQADMSAPVGSASDATPPSAPANLAATAVSGSQINLSWTASTDNVGVLGYSISRNGAAVGASATTSYADTGLSPGTPYSYTVSAFDAAGNVSAPSAPATATTLAVDTQPPTGSVVINGGAAATASPTVTLTLSATDAQGPVTQMRFSNSGTSWSTAEAYATTKTWTLTSGAGTKTVYVQFQDAAGNWSGAFTDTIVYDATAPAISAVAASNVTAGSATITWVTNEPATSQVEYGTTTAYGSLTSLDGALVTSHSVALGGLAPLTTYDYRVRSRDAAGNEGVGSNGTFTTAGQDTVPPTVPADLVATAVSSSEVDLSWTASSDNVAVAGYDVFRDGAQVGTSSAPSFQDSGLSAATAYTYTVTARDAAGNVSAGSVPATATTLDGVSGFQNEILVSGLNLPTAIKFLPGGDMLVLELGGTIRRIHTDTWEVDPTPFLVLTNIGTLNGQQGLMDLAFDPAFATNHYYYVFYTLGSPNRDRASRFTANADLTGTVAGSELVVYQDPQDANVEHHGGALNFGNDGKLYVTTGDHFNADDSQSLASPRGKVLRFNPDGTVPADNPFYDGAGPNVDAIWALGLRNPFRAFYDAPTGRFYIGDVGGNDYSTAQEEVNLGAKGANYGWPACEGFSCAGNPTYTSPLYAYAHDGRDASITGGFIYRGAQFPGEYQGNYFYADYAQNWIKRLALDANGNVTGAFDFEPPDGTPDGPFGDIVFLCEGPDGALYYVDLGYSDTTGDTGVSKIRRIRFASSNRPPSAVISAQPTEGPPPLTVGFSSAGTTDPEGDSLTFLWDFGDGSGSSEANPVHVYASKGAYSARVQVSDGTSTTLSAPIVISVGSRPVPVISAPADGILFRGGDVIAFGGDATDAEDGNLPASAFTWNIDFLHEGHVHPGLPQTGVKSGTFTIPTSGHDFRGFTRYRIMLTVTDSDGLQGSRSVVIYPEKVNLTFDSIASGLLLSVDGIPNAVPFLYDTLINFTHTIEAPNQALGQSSYTFSSWSDGGAQKHTIVVPATDQSYEATFTVSQVPLPPGLVAGYRFSEGSGPVTADLSGNGITGTLVNGPVWVSGQYGPALSFSGTDYVDLGNPAALQLTGSMTLSAWIRIGANPVDDAAIVAKLGPAGWQLKTSADTGARTAAIQISSNGSDSIQRYSQTVLAANTWYHVAGVYDAAARTLQVYVNGTLDNGVLDGTVPAAQFNAGFDVNIAQRTGNPELFNFLGAIDEVHVYNRALSASEIQTDMTAPR